MVGQQPSSGCQLKPAVFTTGSQLETIAGLRTGSGRQPPIYLETFAKTSDSNSISFLHSFRAW